MKKYIIVSFAIICGLVPAGAQSVEVKWTDQFIYDNKVDGFFDYYLGTNSSYVYAKFSNLALSFNKSDSKIKLLAFDKNTLKKAGEIPLYGYGKDKDKDDMEYHKSIILENVIYVIWTKEEDKKVEVYAETFDNKLKKISSLKKIYEISASKKATDNLIILYNKDIGNKILLGKEFAITEDNQNLKIEYKLINEDFSLVSSNQVTLPIIVLKKQRRDGSYTNLIASYELADDGKIYIEDKVKIVGEEKKKLKKGEASAYPVVMQITPETGDLKEFSVKFPKKNTFNFSWLITKNGIKLYGFFCDLDKDPKGNDTHGMFYLSMDQKTFKSNNFKFSYFDKKFLDQLYAADQENQKKGGGLFKSKEAKASDDESIDDNYVIESVAEEGNDIILFCSIMRNWQETVCTTTNGRTSCVTYYYCTKNNVTAFRLDKSGEIVWASNLDRSITYNNWNIYDMSVVKKGNNYYVVYGSSFQINAEKKNRKSRKSKDQMNDRFEYAVFDAKTGSYKKSEHQVNGFNTKKDQKKYVNASNIAVYDNKMYMACSRTKYKPTTWISCLCPPVFYFLSYSGNSRRGTGYLGAINPLN